MSSSARNASHARRHRVASALTFLVTAGAVLAGTSGDHRTPGILDPAFGVEGRVITDVSGQHDVATAMAVTDQRQIVVAGFAQGPGPSDVRIALARYSSDGHLDAAFGADGRVVIDLGAPATAAAVAITKHGAVVVAGTISRMVGANDILLLRLDPSGTLDPTFGDGGVVVTDFYGTNDTAADMAFTANGDIVVAATVDWSGDTSNTDFGIARFDRDGSLDAAFGAEGKATLDAGPTDFAAALALRRNGQAVIAGTTRSATGEYDTALVRVTRDGRLDTGFGADGRVVADFGPLEAVRDVVMMRNGSIVLVGALPGPGGSDFLVARFLSSGDLDRSFGDAGHVTTDFRGGSDAAFAVLARHGGKIVVAGRTDRTEFPAPATFDNFALARYDRQGRLDREFGTDGLVITDFSRGVDQAVAIASLPRGSLAAAGQHWNGLDTVDFALAAYR